MPRQRRKASRNAPSGAVDRAPESCAGGNALPKASGAAPKPLHTAKESLPEPYLGAPRTPLLRPSFPLAAFLWPARGSISGWEALPFILMVAGLFRWAAGFWGYSGFRKPPMHGDYEAQRHWMELTIHLPVSQWYFYDLPYWGLDYPPLTAYHSWLCGKIGSLINPEWFALDTSRGFEDDKLKVFMRATVLISEYLIYVPAAVILVRRFSRLSGEMTWSMTVALLAILMQPATILIDHVHFQFNTVMLGFVLATMSSLMAGRLWWAAIFFVAALGFKQMALYYALSVFAYLLGTCFRPQVSVQRFVGIAFATVAAFALLLLPLVAGTLYNSRPGARAYPDSSARQLPPLPLAPQLKVYLKPDTAFYPVIRQMLQMVHRIFPFARGLFEDKVANFWCALNLVVKLKKYPPELLPKAALGATLAAILPPNLLLVCRPKKTIIPLAFATTAWGFFLFSYQVHEKSVLLPLLPMTVLLAGNDGLSARIRAWVGFANILGCWTMFPLLQRVDLRIPYAVLTLLWAYLLGLPPTCLDAYSFGKSSTWAQIATSLVHGCFYVAMGLWHVAEVFVAPPADKPDLWAAANVGIGAVGFGLCYLWCLGNLMLEATILPQPHMKKRAKAKAQ